MRATRDIVTRPRHSLRVTTLTARRVAELPAGGQILHPMPLSTDPHADSEHPTVPERRAEEDRRSGERRQLTLVLSEERRTRGPRRRTGNRRARPGTRGTETAEEHVRNALQLLTAIAETEALDDELRRDLDAAIFRLHFAIERLRRGDR